MENQRYVVIKFLVLPYNDIEEYVIVPESWIRWQNSNEVAVAYPEEDPSRTNERVENNENDSKMWKIYMATLLHTADSYIEALQILHNIDTLPVAIPAPTVDDNINELVGELNINESTELEASVSGVSEPTHDEASASTSQDGTIIQDTSQTENQEGTPRNRRTLTPYKRPPGFNPNDRSHMFRHPEPAPNNVELLPDSRVYIDPHDLENAQRSRNPNEMARALVTAVFTRQALENCSLLGAEPIAFDLTDSDIRPGLNLQAINAIITVVENFSNEAQWNIVMKSLEDSIRYVLRKFRSERDD